MPKIPTVVTDKLLGWLEEFGTSLGADIVARMMFGDPRVASNALTLIKEGKKEEVKKLLEARSGGWGQEDEQILITDLLAVSRGKLATPAQVRNLIRFLAGLPEPVRRSFRLAHVKEPDYVIRYGNLAELAKKRNDRERLETLTAAGILEPNPVEQAVADLNRRAGASNTRVDVIVNRRLTNLRAPLPRLTWRQWLRDLLDINPLQ